MRSLVASTISAQACSTNDTIFGQAGDDLIAGKKGIDALLGGIGRDSITGNGILVGVDDIDTLTATGPRNILIGGLGADTLNAATGTAATGDLLIGGWTDWDTNLDALQSIRAEWNLTSSISTRMSHITGSTPGGLNGIDTFVIDLIGPGGTTHDDLGGDIFRDSRADDWLFVFTGDIRITLIGQVNPTRNNPC